MAHPNTQQTEPNPPAEIPLPVDPVQDPSGPESPQPKDPMPDPVSPEVPEPSDAPEVSTYDCFSGESCSS